MTKRSRWYFKFNLFILYKVGIYLNANELILSYLKTSITIREKK